eukprot:350168-Chlamydomonas_euryale.AAC.5
MSCWCCSEGDARRHWVWGMLSAPPSRSAGHHRVKPSAPPRPASWVEPRCARLRRRCLPRPPRRACHAALAARPAPATP